ncbi:hypothetical protein COJ27_29940 [Bacillus cereus]|uniref:hypothetical protein n=1 Tax=Bacillus cereus TaxID=1396 RepID=UPI000BF58FE0|nr:hypothetical protein [Bacillus cereus]PFL57223.1 hypothetical protein COJ27_29940 [Bacillus cereus]
MFYCVNLEEHNNNKGITSYEDKSNGELDSLTGLSIPKDFFRENMNFIYESQDIPFVFNINNNFDNFEVENQLIKIRPNLYSDIFFVGTCYGGSYYHNVDLMNDNNIYSKKLHLSDLNSEISDNGDICFKTFDYMHSHQGINRFIKPKIWFYHMSFNSNLKLNHLKFGYNPFIHIFSITMKEV